MLRDHVETMRLGLLMLEDLGLYSRVKAAYAYEGRFPVIVAPTSLTTGIMELSVTIISFTPEVIQCLCSP